MNYRFRKNVLGFARGSARYADAVAFGQFKKSCLAQVREVFVPDDNLSGGQSGNQQTFDDRLRHDRTRAAGRAGSGDDFETHGVPRGNQTQPRVFEGGFAGQTRQAALNHGRDFSRLRIERRSGARFLHDHHSRAFGRVAIRRAALRRGRR